MDGWMRGTCINIAYLIQGKLQELEIDGGQEWVVQQEINKDADPPGPGTTRSTPIFQIFSNWSEPFPAANYLPKRDIQSWLQNNKGHTPSTWCTGMISRNECIAVKDLETTKLNVLSSHAHEDIPGTVDVKAAGKITLIEAIVLSSC